MNGIVLIGADEVIESRAKGRGLPLEVVADISQATLPWDKTLIVQAGTRLPWDLLPAAWHFLDKWDAAVPLWRYGVLATDVGSEEERRETAVLIRDMRVLLHSVELLFVRSSQAGAALLDSYLAHCRESSEPRLAFLRAMYQVKPRLCVLPRSWLAEVQQWRGTPPVRATPPPRPMVTLEIAPGKFVKCAAGDEAKVRAMHAKVNGQGDNDMPVVSNKSFTVSTDKSRAAKGPLVKVQLPAGNWVKMYQADAIAQGLIDPPPAEDTEGKGQPPQGNKMQPPAENKGTSGTAVPDVPDVPAEEGGETAVAPEASPGTPETLPDAPDDFAKYINGVGLATARLINANGITTFAQLRTANLDFLSPQARQAVEEWKAANG